MHMNNSNKLLKVAIYMTAIVLLQWSLARVQRQSIW